MKARHSLLVNRILTFWSRELVTSTSPPSRTVATTQFWTLKLDLVGTLYASMTIVTPEGF